MPALLDLEGEPKPQLGIRVPLHLQAKLKKPHVHAPSVPLSRPSTLGKRKSLTDLLIQYGDEEVVEYRQVITHPLMQLDQQKHFGHDKPSGPNPSVEDCDEFSSPEQADGVQGRAVYCITLQQRTKRRRLNPTESPAMDDHELTTSGQQFQPPSCEILGCQCACHEMEVEAREEEKNSRSDKSELMNPPQVVHEGKYFQVAIKPPALGRAGRTGAALTQLPRTPSSLLKSGESDNKNSDKNDNKDKLAMNSMDNTITTFSVDSSSSKTKPLGYVNPFSKRARHPRFQPWDPHGEERERELSTLAAQEALECQAKLTSMLSKTFAFENVWGGAKKAKANPAGSNTNNIGISGGHEGLLDGEVRLFPEPRQRYKDTVGQ